LLCKERRLLSFPDKIVLDLLDLFPRPGNEKPPLCWDGEERSVLVRLVTEVEADLLRNT
jgi:hypothetical protein